MGGLGIPRFAWIGDPTPQTNNLYATGLYTLYEGNPMMLTQGGFILTFGVLQVFLAGVDKETVTDMSGGWQPHFAFDTAHYYNY